MIRPDGRLAVPAAEIDPRVGGVAHTTQVIGPDDPDYARLHALALAQAEDRTGEQDELDHYLAEHAPEGRAMLNLLRRQLGDGGTERRAS
jgi:hypothetical protein